MWFKMTVLANPCADYLADLSACGVEGDRIILASVHDWRTIIEDASCSGSLHADRVHDEYLPFKNAKA